MEAAARIGRGHAPRKQYTGLHQGLPQNRQHLLGMILLNEPMGYQQVVGHEFQG